MKHSMTILTAALLCVVGCRSEYPDSFPVVLDEREAVRSVGVESPCLLMTILRAECAAWRRSSLSSDRAETYLIDVTVWLDYDVKDMDRLARIALEEGNEGVIRIEARTERDLVLASTFVPVENWPEQVSGELEISARLGDISPALFGGIHHVRISWD